MSDRREIAFRWHARLEDFVTQLAWSPDGTQIAAASVSGPVGIWKAETGQSLLALEKAHPDGCDALAWRPDGLALATAGRDGHWRLWNVADGKLLIEHEAGALWPEHAAWSPKPPQGQVALLALSAGNKVSLWNEAGAPVGDPFTFPRPVAELAWTVQGQLLIGYSTGISLRDPATGTEIKAFPSRDPILSLALSPSGRWLMAGNQDCSVHVWNTETRAEMHMRGYAAKVRQMTWHRGSRWLATGGGEVASVWDCSGRGPEGRTPTLLEWHNDLITALHYQLGGDWLATGARDGSIGVWSPTQRNQFLTGGKIASGITRVAWSPDGRQLAASGEAGEIQILAVE